ncbi:MAG: glycoside hydrolase family 15 protein [Ginsengibacter sp.]
MADNITNAPGAPGNPSKWTSSSKSGIGKSINAASEVAFTLSHGIVNEVFYPREDIACIRDMEFIVSDGKDFFSEEKRHTDHQTTWMKEGVPAFKIINTCHKKNYVIEKEIVTDPIRDTLLQKITFTQSEQSSGNTYQLYALIAPHIHNQGAENNGWKGKYKGVPMLFAQRHDITMALVCSTDFIKCSVGYVGTSDGYTDLKQHKQMTWEYQKASDGNIAMIGQIDLSKSNTFTLAISFGRTPEEAGNKAWASLLDGFNIAQKKYIYEWEKWQRLLRNIKSDRNTVGRNFRTSAAILKMHESKKFPGGIIASLSIPWGQTKGDGELGGYHLVWPRDLVLSSGGFLELGAKDDVLRILNYLMAAQEEDGRWSQNTWLEGVPFWKGIQMDEVALPILMVHTSFQKEFLTVSRCKRYWPIIKKALAYLVTNGPFTPQDRWEEEAGFTPFTLAAQIAALLGGANLAEIHEEKELAVYCREVADFWNENIEKWLYVSDTFTSRELNVDGYYMRINPYDLTANEVKDRTINLKNHEGDDGKMPIGEVISVDALALVRFGLRAADDPRILNTLKVIDSKLKIETPSGPCWYRYTNDGYGEDENGNAYTYKGIGRPWPLLTGERAHYEIAAGNVKKAISLLKTMEGFAENYLLPEQIWDQEDIPRKGLFFGRPSGSAMPLTWAHAEYLKLCSSIKNKEISDIPYYTRERYITHNTRSPFSVWRFSNQIKSISNQKILRIEVMESALIKWTDDNWQTYQQTKTRNTGLGIYLADIPSKNKYSEKIIFTFYWEKGMDWENNNFEVNFIK